MSKELKAYFAIVGALAFLFALGLDWGALLDLGLRDWAGLGAFILLAVLSQALAVDSTVGASKPIQSSIAFLPLLAVGVVLPTPALVLATGGMTAVTELVFRDRVWSRAVFNTSQTILSYGCGALVFHFLTGWLQATPGEGVMGFASLFFPFYALAITFFALNALFVSIGLALRQAEKLRIVLRETVGRGGGNLLYDLLASPIALFVAYLYESFYIGGLLAVVLPLLLIRLSYLSVIQLQQANRDLLRVLVKAIETRDPYTSGHSMRVSILAKNIAEDYGLRPSTVSQVETAALLHDIGKIDALYAEIISKATSLNDEEIEVIRTHASKGADILASLTSLDREIVEGVRHHHERFDGQGYPDGLKGKEIPLAARIIMICDSVDAMLSDRAYRRALPLSEVRKELRRCAGTQFDPNLVSAILKHGTLERADSLADRSRSKDLPLPQAAVV